MLTVRLSGLGWLVLVLATPDAIGHATTLRPRGGILRRHRCRAPPLCMKIRIGILGMPNVGKSCLFNALAQQSIAQAANFPFCTIEPNIAPISVPTRYLARLGTFAGTQRTVAATIEWVDVAGLARGASRGEGLGNKFLANARECDAICHVVRSFDDPDTIHVEGRVNPAKDAELVNLELLLADTAHVERRLEKTTCRGEERAALEELQLALQHGVPARAAGLTKAQIMLPGVKSMGLLTLKPCIYAFNVDEIDFALDHDAAVSSAEHTLQAIQYRDPIMDRFTIVSAKLEAELGSLSSQEQARYLDGIGMKMGSLGTDLSLPAADTESMQTLDGLLSYNVLPLLVCELLGLSLAYTGPGVSSDSTQTTKAHLFRQSELSASGLASRIHGDLERGFMHAEVVSASELLAHDTFAAARGAGCVRTEGRDYALEDDDVLLIKWR
mmetsp:Transcript_4480/g.11808  ORF Transcript_4480/g.11808 Transcript_4480/m.11808 type:complete len:442 (+) Transcript_4480:40-1365(+)